MNKIKFSRILVIFTLICITVTFSACNFGGTSVLDIATQNGLDSTENESTTPTQTTIVNEFNTNVSKDITQVDLYDAYLDLKNNEGYEGSFSKFLREYLGEIDTSESTLEYTTNRCLLSVVEVYAKFTIANQFYTQSGTSAGSGVFYQIDKSTGDALIITNYHVVYNANSTTADGISNEIICYTYGSSSPIVCNYLGGSMQYDLAVLKVTGSEQLKNDDAIVPTFANSDDVTVGETIIAVGNPESDGISATSGILCVDSETIRMTSADSSTIIDHRVMRIDAPINSGNSGGGVFNVNGELIGIANAKMVDNEVDNIAYAIPSNVVKYIVNLIVNQCYGTTRTIKMPIIGVTIQSIESSAYYNGSKAVIVETLIVYQLAETGLLYNKLTIGSTLNKIGITNNSDPENPTTTEYEISRLFQIDVILTAKVGDVVTFYTTSEDGTPLAPVSVTITPECLTDIA